MTSCVESGMLRGRPLTYYLNWQKPPKVCRNYILLGSVYCICYMCCEFSHYYASSPIGLRWCASDVWRRRLSVTYIGPKSRIERPRKTKIGIEVAHVTRDSDTTGQKVKGQLAGDGRILWRPTAQLVNVYLLCVGSSDRLLVCEEVLASILRCASAFMGVSASSLETLMQTYSKLYK